MSPVLPGAVGKSCTVPGSRKRTFPGWIVGTGWMVNSGDGLLVGPISGAHQVLESALVNVRDLESSLSMEEWGEALPCFPRAPHVLGVVTAQPQPCCYLCCQQQLTQPLKEKVQVRGRDGLKRRRK